MHRKRRHWPLLLLATGTVSVWCSVQAAATPIATVVPQATPSPAPSLMMSAVPSATVGRLTPSDLETTGYHGWFRLYDWWRHEAT